MGGTGQFQKIRILNFQKAMVKEIPTYLKSIIMENLTHVKFGITENLASPRPEIKHSSSAATQDSHPGVKVLCTVHLTIAWWGRSYKIMCCWGCAGPDYDTVK